ncbi:MAG TPA: nuclear transport factor 2 family protein [Longimicrobium sp.]|nr:nuclear transport factor 2 family protein [Longimicrobium sp.]
MAHPAPLSEPEAVIHRYFTAFQRRALEEMLSLFDDDVRGIYPSEPQRDWRGREAAAQVLNGYFSRFPDMKLEWRIERSQPEPDSSGVAFYMRNHAVAAGMDKRMFLKYVVSGGRILRVVHLE